MKPLLPRSLFSFLLLSVLALSVVASNLLVLNAIILNLTGSQQLNDPSFHNTRWGNIRWGNVRWGMSIQEVKAAEALPIAAEGQTELAQDFYALDQYFLDYENVEYEGKNARLRYYFWDDKLYSAVLSYPASDTQTYKDLLAGITAKYGPGNPKYKNKTYEGSLILGVGIAKVAKNKAAKEKHLRRHVLLDMLDKKIISWSLENEYVELIHAPKSSNQVTITVASIRYMPFYMPTIIGFNWNYLTRRVGIQSLYGFFG